MEPWSSLVFLREGPHMSSRRRLAACAVVAAATALALASAFGAFTSSRSRSSAGPDARAVGIVVHGAWTIEVRGRDGRLAGRRSFENALVPTGATALASLLGRTSVTGMWQVSLGPAGVCDALFLCNIRESGSATAPPVVSAKTLTVSAPVTGPDANKVLLIGTVVAKNAGSINLVQSAVFTPATPGGALGAEAGTLRQFTRATLPTPITVEAGQEISITVRFSFS